MKYTEHTIKKLEESLQNGDGRVRAVQKAGIDYSTFMMWMRDKRKSNFPNRIKKAEDTGNDMIKDICKRRIIEDKSWQSAAWWLERNFPDEFRNRHEMDHSGKVQYKVIEPKKDNGD